MYFFQMGGKADTRMERDQMLCWVHADSMGSSVCGDCRSLSYSCTAAVHHYLSGARDTVGKCTFMGLPLYWRKHVITVICHTVMSIGERIRPRGMQGG